MKSDRSSGTEGPILHLLAPARQGGLERVVEMLAGGQRSSGVHVACVLSPDEAEDHPFVNRLSSLGIPVSAVVVGGRSYGEEYAKLRELVATARPRVINTHGYRSDLMGIFLARNLGLPVVSTVHGFVGGRARNRINETLQLLVLRWADAVIAVSPTLPRRLSTWGIPQAKIHVVQNGLAPLESTSSRADSRRALGLANTVKVAGWIGRLSREKGADVAIDAIAQCGDSWELSIVGTGPERERLHDQIKNLSIEDRVTLHGEIPNAAALMSAFDAFVLSSRTEGTPIVLLEAMASGVPIIATSVGGVPDVITSDEAVLVPAETPDQIAAALMQISRDPASASRRAEAGRRRLEAGFTLGAWIARVESVYRAAIAHRSQGSSVSL